MLNKEKKVQPTSESAKPILTQRLSAYQKLKAENKKLKNDIYNIVKNMNKVEGIITKARYELQYEFSDVVWFGDPTKPNQ